MEVTKLKHYSLYDTINAEFQKYKLIYIDDKQSNDYTGKSTW